MPSYTRLTRQQRYTIEAMTRNRSPQKEIAGAICVSPSAVSRELRRDGMTRENYCYAPAGTGAQWSWADDHTAVPALQSQRGNQFALSGTDNASPAFTLENTTFAVPEPQIFGLAVVAFAATLAKRRSID